VNLNELRSVFPKASKSFLEANAEGAGPAAELERDPIPRPLGTRQAEGANPARLLVRVVSVRKRLLDEDNICEKYHVDCCRYAGLVPGDSPSEIRIETSQWQAKEGQEEHTLIAIYEIES
jgi:hypothetical protein